MISLQAQMIQLSQSLGYQNPFLGTVNPYWTQQQPGQQAAAGRPAVAPILTPARMNFPDPRLTNGMLVLAALNKQAFDIDRQIATLTNRAGQLDDKQQKQTSDLERSAQASDRATQRAQRVERQMERQSTEPATASTTLTGKMAALATYLPFPYEREKKRVLGWFAH
jgi:hypothetical protein